MKFLVKFYLEFDLKLEISDGQNLVKFWGKTFRPARKARLFSGRFSGQISEQNLEKISETSFRISRLFFSETSFSRRAVLNIVRSWDVRMRQPLPNISKVAGQKVVDLTQIWLLFRLF